MENTNKERVLFWDTETTTRELAKRKASPFTSENWVVAQGWAYDDEAPKGEYFGKQRPGAGWFIKLLHDTSLIVGHNLKFDILHMMQDTHNRAAYMQWVANGGMIWDTQLAEYLLDGQKQESFYLSLNDCALRYGGNTKIDEVKLLWEAGISTEDIDRCLLMDYLLGTDESHGDIGNTRVVYQGQIKRATEVKQTASILLNMGSLISSIEMEFNGMRVDTPLGESLRVELAEALSTLTCELNEYIPKDLPFEFKWSSPNHKSALIFGGQVKYQSRVAILDEQGNPTYSMKDELRYLLTDDSEVSAEESTLPEYQERAVRFKSGKNAGEWKTRKVKVPDLDKPKTRIEDFHYIFPGVTTPKPTWAGSTPGVYSVSAAVIEELSNRDIPFLQALGQVTAMTKDLGTYYWVEKEGVRKGMLTLVTDEMIHHSINHTSTVTGRFSSSNPNLQNIPKGNKSKIKTVFRSRFDGGLIIQSDFSALEVYVQANITRCAQLIKDLLDGLDMHCMRLASKEHMPYEAVYKLCKIDCDPAWDYKRTKAKEFSFQRAYGAGANKIADSTGMPLVEVEALIVAEEQRYPEIKSYFNNRALEIKASRVPTQVYVQHPEIPGLTVQLGRGSCRTPDGKLYTYMESPSPASMARKGIQSSFSPTIIQNYEVQGMGAEWMKAAMYLTVRSFYAMSNFGGKALLINTVHDAQYADAAPEFVKPAAAVIHSCMELASDYLRQVFDWDIKVPVPTDTMAGGSMAEEDKIEGLESLIAQVKPRIAKQTNVQIYFQ